MEFGLFRTMWTVRNREVSVRRGSIVKTFVWPGFHMIARNDRSRTYGSSPKTEMR